MINFERDILAVGQQSRDFIAEAGGLPEVSRASIDFQSAIDQTRAEVEAAEFADRFSRTCSDYFTSTTRAGDSPIAPRAEAAVTSEGEAGFKREALRAELDRIQHEIGSLVARLVEVRCDLIVSQQEFGLGDPGIEPDTGL